MSPWRLPSETLGTGEIRSFVRGSIPDGWLPCDGRLLPIARHQDLFAVIGTRYGGDGQRTFAVPDLLDRLPVHPNGDETRAPLVALGQVYDLEQGERERRLRVVKPTVFAIAAPDRRPRRYAPPLPDHVVLGEVRMFAGDVPPNGWLGCNGQRLRFEQQPTLGAMLDGVYGGDGRLTYDLPDLRGHGLVSPAGMPGPLGERWYHQGRRSMPTTGASQASAYVGILHVISTAGELPRELRTS